MANTVLSPQYLESLVSEISLRHGNPECFQLNSVQCKHLCHALRNVRAVRYNFLHKYPSAQKEIYRTVKEAEIYLHHCSSSDWPLKFLTRSTTGEGCSLHLHDLALCCLLLDVIPITDTREICRKICNFFEEMGRFMKIRHPCADELQLIKTCEQFAERSTHTIEDKIIVEVSKFLGEKLKGIIPIPGSTEVRSTVAETPIPTWLKIDPADLVLKSEIGEGSFGHVYEGSWLGLRVAAKEMPRDYRDVFELEASILAKLQSPFIVHLIGTCIKDSHLYLVMEFVSSNLEQFLQDRSNGHGPPLLLPVAVDIMLQISRAMEYLHNQEIMHLDLKASNVLFELSSVPELREEGYGRVKLCDFGTASPRLFSFRGPDPKGTCYWRAPEVFPSPCVDIEIDTTEKYTNKADVYSFAMTCYEILSGKQPFAGVLPRDLYTKVCNGKRPTLEPSICPFILANFIQQCWDTDPDQRPCFEAVSNFLTKLKLWMLNSPFDWEETRVYSDFGYVDGEEKSIFTRKVEKWKHAKFAAMNIRLDKMLLVWRFLTLEMRRGIAIDIASFLARMHGNSTTGFLNLCVDSSTIYLDWELKPIFSGVASATPLHGRGQREREAKRVEEFTNIQSLGKLLVQLSTGCIFVDFWKDYVALLIGSLEVIDPQLVKEMEKRGQRHRQLWEVVRWCELGLWCLSESPSQQPTIHTVLLLLKDGAQRFSTLPCSLSYIPYFKNMRYSSFPRGDWPSGDCEGAIDADYHLGLLWKRKVLS